MEKQYILSWRARLAVDLLAHNSHALIAARSTDDEDTAGRQKIVSLSPKDVAVRICEVVDAFVTEVEARQWVEEDRGVVDSIAALSRHMTFSADAKPLQGVKKETVNESEEAAG